jgi:hypothetical protein
VSLFSLRVQLNEAQDEIMKKKVLLEDLQPDNTQTCESRTVLLCCTSLVFSPLEASSTYRETLGPISNWPRQFQTFYS